MLIAVTLVVAGLAGAVYLLLRRGRSRGPRSLNDYAISTSSETQARAERALPLHGSEDQKALLERPRTEKPSVSEAHDYLPTPGIDWIVSVDLQPDAALSKAELQERFSTRWLKDHGSPTIHGRAPDGRWTFARAGDVSGPFSALKLAWKLNKDFQPGWMAPTAADLQRYVDAVKERLASCSYRSLEMACDPADAATQAQNLVALKERLDQRATVVLQATGTHRFEGRALWDVMMSLGLEWGDMDIFHWKNHSHLGDDSFFSVWTTTPPGYFFPEEIAAGRVRVENLVFGFSIPRTYQPSLILESMLRAAGYAQKRLGGTLLNESGRSLTVEDLTREVGQIAAQLTEAGYAPGENKTLYLF